MFFFILAIVIIVAGLIAIGIGVPKGETFSLRPAGAGGIVLGVILMLLSTFTVVDAGNVGVPQTLGSVGSSIAPGFHMVAPWTDVSEISIKTQEYTMSHVSNDGKKAGDDSVAVQSLDNATLNIDSTVLYHVDGGSAANLFKKYGTDYEGKIVRPTIRSAIRDAATEFQATELGTSKRRNYEQSVATSIEKGFTQYGLVLESVKIRDIGLPQTVIDSINAKIKAQQNVVTAQFELQNVTIEAQKKIVIAKGSADAQQIIACGSHDVVINKVVTVVPNGKADCDQTQLTPEYLQFLYIQSLQKIAESPNNSTIVVPFDTKLTPLLNVK